MPTRRAIAVAATASGGATTAPSATPAASPRPGTTAAATAPAASAETSVSPTESMRIGRRWIRNAGSEAANAAQ